MEPGVFAGLALAAFTAAIIQAAAGFGFAILAVPVFLLVLESLAAIQIAAVASFALSLVLLPRLWHTAPKDLLAALGLGSLAGFPIGMAVFQAADMSTAKLAVGLLVAIFAVVLLLRDYAGVIPNAAFQAKSRPRDFAIGVVSGVMSAAFAMPGPAVLIYLAALNVSKDASRALTLTLFAFSYGAVTALHALWGGMTTHTWALAAMLVPVVLLGAVAGHLVARRLSEPGFRVVVLAILLVSGLGTTMTAI